MTLLLIGAALAAKPERADPIPITEEESSRPITVARLILRDESELGTIYSTAENWRVAALETLREHGYDAKGGENVVFGQDNSHHAELVLGGEISDGECWEQGIYMTCWVRVEWQVLDARSQEVIYTQTVEGTWRDDDPEEVLTMALKGALEGLLSYEGFHTLLAVEPVPEWTQPSDLQVKRCKAPKRKLPADVAKVNDAVIVLKTEDGVGTGFLISPDGWALTASHVVYGNTQAQARTHAGVEQDVSVIRVDREQDIALVKLEGQGHACLPVREAEARLGEELFAVGNPLGEELSFSLTRGLVSGVRTLESGKFIQTDAPINPGFSGGPLLDTQGRVLGVISWKIAGSGVEGLSFAVPGPVAMERLGVVLADSSATEWEPLALPEPPPVSGNEATRRFTPDQYNGMLFETSSPSSTSASRSSSTGSTSTARQTTAPMSGRARWGWTLTALGGVTVASTGAWYAGVDETTTGTWRAMATMNTLGWIAMGAGSYLVTKEAIEGAR